MKNRNIGMWLFLILSIILAALLINRYNYAKGLEAKNKDLEQEIAQLNEKIEDMNQDQAWINQAKILMQLQESFSKGDFEEVIKIYTMYEEELTDNEVFKEAKKIFETSMQSLENTQIVNDLVNQADRLKDEILDFLY